jgi:hypothetical protein
VSGNFVKLDAITTSATATYNLLNGGVAYFPQTANNCIVSLNGVIQSPTSAYTISGSTIVFSDALTASDSIDFILVLGDVLNIGTPSDATVSFAKVTSNLITGATAETSIAGGDSVLIYDDSASALRKMTRTNFVAGVGGTNTPAFQATLSANQTISHNTETKVQFNSETFDTNSAYDPTTNYRFTVPSGEGGKYFIYANINLQGTNNREHEAILRIKVNGSADKITIVGEDLTQSTVMQLNLSTVVSLSATDYVEITIYQYDYTASSTMTVLDTTRAVFGGFKLIGV